MAHVARLRVYPVKSLDGVEVDAASVTAGGTLAGDREYALVGPDGNPITARRTAALHRLRTDYHPGTRLLTVEAPGDDAPARFDLADEPGAAAAWFSAYLGREVTLRRNAESGFVDRPGAGPSVVSTATIAEVATWFDDLTPEGVRRRLRANVEVDGVPAFWEDRFVGGGAPAFVVGGGDDEVRVEGVEPCARCVVPTRDPDTGEPTEGFRETFIERRAETFPEWADRKAFDHDYALMLIARVPEAYRGKTLRVGDDVTVVDEAS